MFTIRLEYAPTTQCFIYLHLLPINSAAFSSSFSILSSRTPLAPAQEVPAACWGLPSACILALWLRPPGCADPPGGDACLPLGQHPSWTCFPIHPSSRGLWVPVTKGGLWVWGCGHLSAQSMRLSSDGFWAWSQGGRHAMWWEGCSAAQEGQLGLWNINNKLTSTTYWYVLIYLACAPFLDFI